MGKNFDFKAITKQFCLYGDLVSVAPYGNGHINDTFEVIFDQAGCRVRYILQRINTNVFRDPVNLMENIRCQIGEFPPDPDAGSGSGRQ